MSHEKVIGSIVFKLFSKHCPCVNAIIQIFEYNQIEFDRFFNLLKNIKKSINERNAQIIIDLFETILPYQQLQFNEWHSAWISKIKTDFVSIPKANDYYYNPQITIVQVNQISIMNNMLDYLESLPSDSRVGLGTESDVNNHRVYTLQLATTDKTFVILLNYCQDADFLLRLYLFLIKKDVTKIVFGPANDLKSLKMFCPSSLKAIWNEAISLEKLNSFGFYYIQTTRSDGSLIGLVEAAELKLNFKINKSWTISAWESNPLLPDQLKYAAIDAYVLLELYNIDELIIQEEEHEFCQNQTMNASQNDETTAKSFYAHDKNERQKTMAIYLSHPNVDYNVINKHFLRLLFQQEPFKNNQMDYYKRITSKDESQLFYRMKFKYQYKDFDPFILKMNETEVYIKVKIKFYIFFFIRTWLYIFLLLFSMSSNGQQKRVKIGNRNQHT